MAFTDQDILTGHARSAYTPELAGRIVERVGNGDTFETIAADLAISQRTLKDWAAQHPEFAEAMQQARTTFLAHNRRPLPPNTPSKYNAEVHKTIVEAKRLGCTNAAIAGIIGVNRHTVDCWLNETHEQFIPALHADVEHARGEGMLFRLGIIERAALKGAWQAAAWMLEREYPERYALSQARIEVNTTTVQVSAPERAQLEAAAAVVAELRQRILAAKDVTPPPPPPTEDETG